MDKKSQSEKKCVGESVYFIRCLFIMLIEVGINYLRPWGLHKDNMLEGFGRGRDDEDFQSN